MRFKKLTITLRLITFNMQYHVTMLAEFELGWIS